MTSKAPFIECAFCKARSSSIFSDLEESELSTLSSNKRCRAYRRGQIIFFEGDHPHGLFCINEGKVKLYKLTPQGKEQITRLAGPSDIMGYRSLLSHQPLQATAEALEPTKVCFIPEEVFFKMLDANVALSLNIMKYISSEMSMVERHLFQIAQKPVRERLAETLLFLKQKFGLTGDPPVTLNIRLTREELANLIGTAPETVIRALHDLKEEGIIHTKGRTLQLLDLDRLVQIAQLND